jgi:phage terminase small subunit
MGQAAGNATAAAKLAGYSVKSARRIGTRLSTKAHIQFAIRERQAVRSEQSDVDAVKVIREMARIGFADIRKLFRPDGSLKPAGEWDDDTAASVAGIDVVEMAGGAKIGGPEGLQHVAMYTKKLRCWDKNSALEKIAKHLGMFEEKHVHSGRIEIGWLP